MLDALYADGSAPRLGRKYEVWARYRDRKRLCRRGDLNPHDLSVTAP